MPRGTGFAGVPGQFRDAGDEGADLPGRIDRVEQTVVHDDRFGPVHGHVDELRVDVRPHGFGDEQVAGFGAVVERVQNSNSTIK